VGDAVAICFPVVTVGNEEVVDRTESVEGYGLAEWHGGVEIDGIGVREMYAEGGLGRRVCGFFVYYGSWLPAYIFLVSKREGSLWRGGW